jgi:prepilin-type N-terminal cleavage/methylation domain-containing protein/prepilin-type processing-associated H-X9-DG protein
MRRAFTLIELLVVIVLIAVLATLTGVVADRYIEAGRATSCMNNLRTLGTALNLYLADNNATMPTLLLGREKSTEKVPVIDNTLDHYLPGDSGKKAFLCPSDHVIGAKSGTSYHWNVALNGQSLASLNFMGVAEQPGYIPLMGDKEGFHRDPEHKVNILYADGHASKELTFADKVK